MARTVRLLLSLSFYLGIVLLSGLSALQLGLWLDGRAIAQLDWQRGLLVSDPGRGWVGRPGAARWVENGSHDVFVENDADGDRMPVPPRRPGATHRILVLGGSTAWGKGVGQGDVVSDWLRRELPGWVSVQNRAVPGHGPAQIRETAGLARQAQPYDEILLLLSPADLHDGDAWRRAPPFSRPGADSLRIRLEETSRATRFLSRHWDRVSRKESAPPAPSAVDEASLHELGLAVAELARAHEARLVMVYAPGPVDLGADGEPASAQLRDPLRELAAVVGASFVDLTDALQASQPKLDPELLIDRELGLWTHHAHSLAAHTLIQSGRLAATEPAFPSGQGSTVGPHDPLIQYSGRVDRSKRGEVRFDWPGVTIRVRVEANACRFLLRTEKEWQYFNVTVDGRRHFVFRAGPEGHALELRALGPGPHEIEVQKRAQSAPVTFLGLELPPASRMLEPAPLPERRIEILGASVAGGMGTEGFLYGHHNLGVERRLCADERRMADVDSTFGAVLADAYGAEVRFATHDAAGVIRNYKDSKPRSDSPFPAYFGRTLQGSAGEWKGDWQPDLVVLNLGENDYGNELPLDEPAFRAEYVRFLELLRDRYPHAYLIAFDLEDEEALLARIAEAIAQRHAAGDDRVELIPYPDTERADKGCKSHPTAAYHRALAQLLAGPVETALGWSLAEPSRSRPVRGERTRGGERGRRR